MAVVKTMYISSSPNARNVIMDYWLTGAWWLILPTTDVSALKVNDLTKKYDTPTEGLQSIKVIDTDSSFPAKYVLLISKVVFPLEDVTAYFPEYRGLDMDLLAEISLLIVGDTDPVQTDKEFKAWLNKG